MTHLSSISLDEVRAALDTRAVLEAYGWTTRREGDELVSHACPARPDHSRPSFKINSSSGRWQCFPCGTKGDLLDFIALVEDLDIRADFGGVLAKAAEIAGVGPSLLDEQERAAKRAEWTARRRAREAQERAARQERERLAVPRATSVWEELLDKHPRGLEYLDERGILEVAQRTPGALVRFDGHHGGSPAVCLYASDGRIRNVVSRRVPECGEPKTPGLAGCPTAGTLVNAVCQIERERDVVLTEGVIDSLTARLAWQSAVILGAHGAGNLPKIAKLAAPAVKAARGRLLVVPHHDRAGYDHARQACVSAMDAGLSIRRGSLAIVSIAGAKDLNDAWRAGWRAA